MTKLLNTPETLHSRGITTGPRHARMSALCGQHDGVSTISDAQKHQPDLIILDLGLPSGDGFVVLEWLRANAYLALIPVIVVSGRRPARKQGTRS